MTEVIFTRGSWLLRSSTALGGERNQGGDEASLDSAQFNPNQNDFSPMKTLAKLTLLAAGLAVSALPLIRAEAPVANQERPAGHHPYLRAMAQRQEMRKRIAHRLGLSADQIAKLKASRLETATAIKAIRADASLTPAQKKAKARETLQGTRVAMRSVLTPDQLAKWDKARKHLRERRQGAR